MLLAVDIGNTTIHFALFSEKEIVSECKVSTWPLQSVEEYKKVITALLPNPNSVILRAGISSVVPEVIPGVIEIISLLSDRPPVIISRDSKTPINAFAAAMPTIGNDRIANAAAGIINFDTPLLIVDFGTATTFCVIDNNNNYLGGAIAPGIKISAESLYNKASQLENVELDAPADIIAQTSEENIRSGVVYGHASMVDGMIVRIEKEFGGKLKHVATGGYAQLITPLCKEDLMFRKNLTLEGIKIITEMNI